MVFFFVELFDRKEMALAAREGTIAGMSMWRSGGKWVLVLLSNLGPQLWVKS